MVCPKCHCDWLIFIRLENLFIFYIELFFQIEKNPQFFSNSHHKSIISAGNGSIGNGFNVKNVTILKMWIIIYLVSFQIVIAVFIFFPSHFNDFKSQMKIYCKYQTTSYAIIPQAIWRKLIKARMKL